jgi:hypothetical protein
MLTTKISQSSAFEDCAGHLGIAHPRREAPAPPSSRRLAGQRRWGDPACPGYRPTALRGSPSDTGRNALVDGVEEPEKFVLFSGHVDSWHYGAMDNGSANATMLETPRVLLPYRSTFRRGLRLAFWSGHSHGRYADSTWYADPFWENLHENCVAHINVDSTDGQGAVVLSETPAMAETQPCAAAIIRALTGTEFTGTRFGRAGDQSFQGHGILSLFMSLSVQPVSGGDSAAEMPSGSAGRGCAGGLGWW